MSTNNHKKLKRTCQALSKVKIQIFVDQVLHLGMGLGPIFKHHHRPALATDTATAAATAAPPTARCVYSLKCEKLDCIGVTHKFYMGEINSFLSCVFEEENKIEIQ